MKFRNLIFVAAALIVASGCKEYQSPVFEEIDTSDTAFLVSLETTGGDKTSFSTEAEIAKAKVNVKRVENKGTAALMTLQC